MRKEVIIRVDVDTSTGLKKGVPILLDIFDEYDIKATFFIPMGPDTLGKVAQRFFNKKGFFKRILKVNPFYVLKKFGLTIFYGTLLPPPFIGRDNPKMLRLIEKRGHEVALHGYDHSEWQDGYDKVPESKLENNYFKAVRICHKIIGKKPMGAAAPGWKCNDRTLRIQSKFNMGYISDSWGNSPFRPVFAGKSYDIIQLPITMPPIDHLDKKYLKTKKGLEKFIRIMFNDGYNMLNIHAENEAYYIHH
jgi:undecaprenyl phosphate-alpha-L-ara4FN deformylase